MRSTLLFLLFSAGSAAALGQAGPVTPEQSQQALSPWNAPGTQLQGREFSKWPRWDPALNSQSRTVLLPPLPAGARARLGDAGLDPKFIRHPSTRDLGVQPPGTQVAQNLFPGLVFQPIDQECAPSAAGPLATTWPGLKVERITTEWPRLKMGPITGEAPRR